MCRYSDLSLHTADPLSKARADALNQAKVEEYFKLLFATVDEHDLTHNPFQIYM